MYIEKVCVFCGASSRCDSFYLNEAEKLGRMLALADKTIVYGGGNIGSMGRLADGALAEGGKVIGIIPDFLQNLELGHREIAELRKVDSMHSREAAMMKESDCVIALPGSTGTFSELIQAVTWKRLGLILSPIIIVNLRNYYYHLIEMLKKSEEENFMRKSNGRIWTEADTTEDVIAIIQRTMPDSPVYGSYA